MISDEVRAPSVETSTLLTDTTQSGPATTIERRDPSVERKLLSKVDRHVIPILFALL